MPVTWGGYATTVRTLDAAWTGAITIENIDDNPVGFGVGTTPHGIMRSVSVAGVGCSCGIEEYGSGNMTGPPAGWPAAAKAAVNAFTTAWPFQYTWYLYRFFAQVGVGLGAVVDEVYACTGFGGTGRPFDPPAAWHEPFGYDCSYSMSIDNMELRMAAGDSTPEGRRTRDFIDLHARYGWFVTDDTTVTVSMSTPVGNLSASGSWASGWSVGLLDDAAFEADAQATYSISYAQDVGGAVLNTDYATISPTWAGVDLNLSALDDSSTDGANWTHWWDGDEFTSPWPPTEVWSAHGSGGAIHLHRTGATSSDATWTGYSRVPFIIALNAAGGRWSDTIGDFADPIRFDFAGLKDSGGQRVYLGAGQSAQYVESQHSWYTEDLFDGVLTCDVKGAWAADNDEDVESGALTDLPVPIAIWGLDVADYTGSPWESAAGLLDVSHAAVNVHKPDGVARPSLWVGSGGLTVTGQDDTTVTFTVAAGAVNPTLTRTLTTRYWTQLDRLQPPNSDSALAYKADWPIMLKANLSTAIGGAIPAGDPDLAALTADEDVTNYDNHRYLRLHMAVPRTSALQVRLAYNELQELYDPCYSSWQYRFGPDGEWSYSKGPDSTATYGVDHEGNALDDFGDGDWLIDLRCPVEGELSRGALQHVSAITISGFAVPEAGTDSWTLHADDLTLQTGAVVLDGKRAWDWEGNFFGVAGRVDGASVLAIKYGYEQFEAQERGLKYQQYAQHNPGSSATDDPTSLKSLSRLADELSWQEGFEATYTADGWNGRYTDGDGTGTFDTPYWFFLRDEADEGEPLAAAAVVRSVTITRGVAFNFHVDHWLQGRLHGLLKDDSGTTTRRSEADAVTVEASYDGGGSWSTVETVGSDADGRWASSPLREKDAYYRVSTTTHSRSGLQAVNRSLTEVALLLAEGEGRAIAMYQDPTGVQWIAWIEGTSIKVNRLDAGYTTWGTPVVVSSAGGSYDSVDVSGDGRVLYVAARHATTNKPWTWYSLDQGRTWTGPTLSG